MKDPLNYSKIAQYVAGECSEEEARAFESELEKYPDLSKLVKEFQKIWKTKKNRQIFWDVDSAWMHFNGKLGQTGKSSHRDNTVHNKPLHSHYRRKKNLVIRVAAIFMVIALTGLIAVLCFGNFEQNEQIALKEVITEKGQRVQIHLEDGSRIQLNADSKIIYPEYFETAKRTVQLTGEAYFEVNRDNRPFFVYTDGVAIEILGTEFNVKAYGDESVQVVVAEGKVRVLPVNTADQQAVELERGDMARLDRNGIDAITIIHDVDLQHYLGWLEYRLTFKEAKMAQVIMQLERWYGIEIEIADPEIAEMTLSANFVDETVQEVLQVIKLALDLEYDIEGRKVTFYPQS